MFKRRASFVVGAAIALSFVWSLSVSADESTPPVGTLPTVMEQFDVESGLIWSQVDDRTIEVSLPD